MTTATLAKRRPAAEPAVRRFAALGTTAVVAVTDVSAAQRAEEILRETLGAIDAACSRFRDDSEIAAVARSDGSPVVLGALAYDAVSIALEVARLTGGAVDPTVGSCMRDLGYDRDFSLLARSFDAEDGLVEAWPAPGWRSVTLDPAARTVQVVPGTWLDLGATAKAFGADLAAMAIAEETGSGVAVSLGGDVSTAGPAPEGGWAIGIARDCTAAATDVDQVVSVTSGGLSSSSPGARTWGAGGRLHHIVDPRTGAPVAPHWTLVSATAPTCVEANAATTAAIVWGPAAVLRLHELGYPARLVRADTEVVVMNGWPHAPSSAARTRPAPAGGAARAR